jgi:uncharacterized protein YjbI with pentapeptide repeats
MLKELLSNGITKDQIKTKNFYKQRFKINFYNWNLSLFDFGSANFGSANFGYANFGSANFGSANFRYANFRSANFRYANFKYANFGSADLNYKINELTFGLTINCPESGSFIAYKKASNFIIKLFIPISAKRSSATSYKCRCNKAKVLSIENIDRSDSGLKSINSNYDKNFMYEVGKIIKIKDFDNNRWNECSTGIHFFMSRKMAECYN